MSDKKHFELGEQATQLSKHESRTTKPPMKPKSQHKKKCQKIKLKVKAEIAVYIPLPNQIFIRTKFLYESPIQS